VRPRFVLILCVAAWLAAAVEMLSAVAGAPSGGFRGALLGLRFEGELGRGYLALLILSFLFFGVGAGSDRATWTLVWQITIVPFATFCYMFLHNGRRYFGAQSPASRVG
jgi:hypothetical protein